MKLNPDCVRDILLLVEETTTIRKPLSISPENLPTSFSAYTADQIMYHIKQCELSGLFGEKVHWYMDGGCMIRYLSPDGHKFLSDIRENTPWKKTKKIIGNVGANSIDTMRQIAGAVIAALIQNNLQNM